MHEVTRAVGSRGVPTGSHRHFLELQLRLAMPRQRYSIERLEVSVSVRGKNGQAAMAQTNKRTRANRLRGVGIEDSMSRSISLGADDPRHRIAADSELNFTQRFDPNVFMLDGAGRVTLRIRQKPAARLMEIDIFRRFNDAADDTERQLWARGAVPIQRRLGR